MVSHIVGYPRMGPKRELKFALEAFWDGKSSAEELQKVGDNLKLSTWKQMVDAGIKFIPSNTFSYYDHVLDTTAMLGAIPPRYGWSGGDIGFDVYFSMARGNACIPAMELTKWFDTNYHYIVPELEPNSKFFYASRKAVQEYREAKAHGIDTVPVLLGPVSYLLLSKPVKGVDKSFSLLSLLDKILPVYKEIVDELMAAGVSWIQFDEPTLVMDLDSRQLNAFTHAYTELESSISGLTILLETYFADIPADAYKTITALKGVSAIGFDLVRGSKTLDLIRNGFPPEKYLFAGVVDGRNIWANDLEASLTTLKTLKGMVGEDKLVVSTSCSLLHTAFDLETEIKMNKELKSWLAFAAQKLLEVSSLEKALTNLKNEAFFSANAAAQASRKASSRVTNAAVQEAVSLLRGSDHRRATNVSDRLEAQQRKLKLPILPTTALGSFPQTLGLRKLRREYKINKISEEDYVKAIKEEINQVVKLQEELDLDVLVHGEPEIHTHMCYSNFNDIIHSIMDMDADVISIENSRSDEKLLSVFHEGVKYSAGIGPGVYDIHSPRIPSVEEIVECIKKMLAVLDCTILWVNPDCGLKTRKYSEVKPALSNMVAAVKIIRKQLIANKSELFSSLWKARTDC
ncbi:5-methyltetrahydropteroyltriglutamate--homocysteine methyltransferase-like isoform X2 [Andrographis paniculata]|uniref:5-methyltetrahydropteroyltriglutamate-- homocysteine methyltransferase-like isoform X2 n=1 Tax=Andrographis paniculata TaxID=175694 RepID=UPI0021E8DD68|nr:5-methyltetrahydropteroyltriglutamate--homocysteine methyltransferase-like isoform X2 [Andrographis paniculata]